MRRPLFVTSMAALGLMWLAGCGGGSSGPKSATVAASKTGYQLTLKPDPSYAGGIVGGAYYGGFAGVQLPAIAKRVITNGSDLIEVNAESSDANNPTYPYQSFRLQLLSDQPIHQGQTFVSGTGSFRAITDVVTSESQSAYWVNNTPGQGLGGKITVTSITPDALTLRVTNLPLERRLMTGALVFNGTIQASFAPK